MAEASQIMFTFPEIAEALIKHQGIHAGHWGVSVRFGIAAANVAGPDGKTKPTALVPLIEMGIQRYDEPNDLTVNAADVNPVTKPDQEPPKTVKRK